MIEKQMTKVKGRSESYAIYISKSDGISEADFKENIASDDNTKCQVIVSFKNEYDSLIQQMKDKNNQIMQLNKRIQQLEDENAKKSSTNKSSTRELYSKIDELKKQKTNLEKKHEKDLYAIHQDHKKEIEAIQDEYNSKIDELNMKLSAKGDEIQDLKLKFEREIFDLKQSLLEKHHDEESSIVSERQKVIDSLRDEKSALLQKQANEISDMTIEKQKIIDKLKREISDLKSEESDMKLNHQKEIQDLKLQHQTDTSDLKSKYKHTLITLRTKDNNEIASYNKKTTAIIEDLKDLGFFAKHTSSYGKLLRELKEALDEFETINKNKLLNVDEEIAKIPSNAVNENNKYSE